MKTYPCQVTLTLICFTTVTASAVLIGDSVRGQLGFTGLPTLAFDEIATVTDPDVEFSIVFPFLGAGGGESALDTANLSGNSIDIFSDLGADIIATPAFFWKFSDLDWVGNTPGIITGVTLTSGPAVDVANIGWTDNSITIDFNEYFNPPQVRNWSFDIQTQHSVPDNGPTLIMLGLTFLGIPYARKKLAGPTTAAKL